MLKKIVGILLLILVITAFGEVYAGDMSDLITKMENVSKPADDADAIDATLATVIKMIQYAGTGIALIVVTIYGIKYMLASPADKADIKKQIFPILIGCTLLFATVNIVGIIADMTIRVGSTLG